MSICAWHRRWDLVSEFVFSVAAADLAALCQMGEHQPLSMMRCDLYRHVRIAGVALGSAAGAAAVVREGLGGIAAFNATEAAARKMTEEQMAAAVAATEALARLKLWRDT